MQGFDYLDLGGGLNVGSAPGSIQPREFLELDNWYPYGNALIFRGGTTRITTAGPWSQQITGMFPLKRANGSWVLLVGGPTGFGRLVGAGIVDIPSSGLFLNSDLRPWAMLQYKDYGYAMRPNAGTIVRLAPGEANYAGIEKPSSAPTLAQGAAGDIPAGGYRAVVTFGNQETAQEGNPSDPSNLVTLPAGGYKFDYSNIPTSTNPFVNMRRIYRTLEDQPGVYFFVAQISDNVTTTYTGDNRTVDGSGTGGALGRTVSFRNGLPPANVTCGTIHSERLFVTDGRDLYPSEFLSPECFDAESVIPVEPDDGHQIRGLRSFGGRLVIGKTNKMHILVGEDIRNFGLIVLSDTHGCMSHHSMQSAEGSLFWYGSGKAVFRTDGTNVRDISTPKVAPILAKIPDDQEELVYGAVLPALNWYVLSIPQTNQEDDNEVNHRLVLVYNYKADSWNTFSHPLDAPQVLANFFTSDFQQVLYSTFYDGHVYLYNDETVSDDFGTDPITATFTTKPDDFGFPGYRKYLGEAWLHIPKVDGEIELEAVGPSSVLASRTADLLDFDNEDAWKAFKLFSGGNPKPTMRLRCRVTPHFPQRYAPQPGQRIEVRGIHVKVGVLNRRPNRLH